VRADSDPTVRTARMTAKRSPYAAEKAKPDGSDGDTTPGTGKPEPDEPGADGSPLRVHISDLAVKLTGSDGGTNA
jgi:hypothetical protein